jgi:hypothetical protein
MLSMDEYRDIELLRSLEKGEEIGLSQTPAVDVAQDLDAVQAERFDSPHFIRSEIHVLEWNRTQRIEAFGLLLQHTREHFVQESRKVEPILGLEPVSE